MTDLLAEPRAVAYRAPPDGRWWRAGMCWRGPAAQRNQMIADLSDAGRARKAHFQLFGPATAELVVDGRSPQASQLQELSQDLCLWRWDPTTWTYQIMFRGPIGRTEDTVSATTHSVNVAAADYRAMLGRVIYNSPRTFAAQDQWYIANAYVAPLRYDAAPNTSLGLNGITVHNPDGTQVGATTGVLRDRTYTGAEKTVDILDNLAKCIGGFDYGVDPIDPTPPGTIQTGWVKLFYPQRGVTKAFTAEYGATVSNLTRTVNSQDFANWVRNDGQNSSPGVPIFAVSAGDAWTNPQLHPEGLWQDGVSNADVNVQATLQQQADGYLAFHSQLVPSYTLTLVPGAWANVNDCWLGDTIAVRVRSGRLQVNTTVRVVGVDFDVDDAGVDRVSLTVARPPPTLAGIVANQNARLDALSRR
jgi:hypothetical protein